MSEQVSLVGSTITSASAPRGTAQPLDASRRRLMQSAATVGLLMRNCVNLVVALVALVALADPNSLARPAGKWLLATLALWSLYRIVSRSAGRLPFAVDYTLVLAVCVGIPILIPDPSFYTFNTAPQAIAGTAVISISVAVSPHVSLLMVMGVAAAYAFGSVSVLGVEELGSVAALYYFGLQWLTAAVIRIMLLRVAGAVDRARSDRLAAELNEQVSAAVRAYEREQLALLHDTAASTLMMVGHGTPLPRRRLAAQARRDLDLLEHGPWVSPPPRTELVGALRDCAQYLSTPVRFRGEQQVLLPGETARTVVAAAREAMNNVDRHARATTLTVTVLVDMVRFEDDGVGFDPGRATDRHGVNDSIVARMHRGGGAARITSAPGQGTTVELSWNAPSDADSNVPQADPDRMIERIRRRYATALTLYAVANLAFAVPHAVTMAGDVNVDALLGAVAAVCALTALVGIWWQRWQVAWPAAIALVVVTVVQPALLPPELVGGYAHWAQNAIGWCVLPLVLGLPTRVGAAVLVLFWLLGAAVTVLHNPTTAVLVNIGLGTGSILGVQLFALVFNGLMRQAAADAQADTQARQDLIARDRIAQALRDEYQRRYATLVAGVVPLLESLSEGGTVDEDLQRRARAESRRLRALFDQATTFDHPLMQRLRPIIDEAEDRHVDVAVDLAGELPEIADEEIDDLVDPAAHLLKAAQSSARLVVTGSPDEITVSIVCDTTPSRIPEIDSSAGDHVEVVTTDDMTWCLTRRTTSATATASSRSIRAAEVNRARSTVENSAGEQAR